MLVSEVLFLTKIKPPTMPEQKMTYPERVVYTSRIHASAHNELLGMPNFLGQDECINDAKTTISMQAEAIRGVWRILNGDTIASMSLCDLHLLEHGYIEPKPKQI